MHPDDNPFTPPASEHNPFAPPQSQTTTEAEMDGEAEELRRRFMNREACIKAIGCLYVIAGIGSAASTMIAFAMMTGRIGDGMSPIVWLSLAYSLALGIFFLWAGSALFGLRNPARLAAIGACVLFMCIGLAMGNFFGIPVQALYLACLIGSGAKHVCSGEYRDVIAQTRRLNGQLALRVVLLAVAMFVVVSGLTVFQFMQRAAPALNQ